MRFSPRGCSPLRLLTAALILAALCFPGKARAINDIQQYVQDVLTVRSGLPQNSVNAIVQTTDGYIWLATQEGIARYDGLRISVFDTANHPNLPDNYITTMAAGRDGDLWVGSRYGLGRFHYGVYESIRAVPTWVNGIAVDTAGTVWAGAVDGLYRISGDTVDFFSTRDGLPGKNVLEVAAGAEGTVWLATDKGLASFSGGKVHDYSSDLGDQIERIEPSRDGSLWIARGQELIRWNGQVMASWPIRRFCQVCTIKALQEDSGGRLWIGLDHSGVIVLENGTLTRYAMREGLPSDDVASVFVDRQQHIWIGMNEAGAVELRRGLFRTIGAQQGLATSMAWSVMTARDGSVWIGTEGHGVNHVLPDGRVEDFTDPDRRSTVGQSGYGLFEDRQGDIWAGSDGGKLFRIHDGRMEVFRDPAMPKGRLLTILEAPGGDLWIAFHDTDGLTRFHNGHFTHYRIPGLLNTMKLAEDGSLWLGTDHAGLVHWQNRVLEIYDNTSGLLSNFCQSVFVDRDGTVWAGASPGGLHRIKNGRVTTYSIEQGLFDRTVGAIVEDDANNLWMSSNKGIFRVSKTELNDYADKKISSIHTVVYGMSDGLRSPEANFGSDPSAWKDNRGNLWFPTVAGVISIDPRHSLRKTTPPAPLIESVIFNGASLPLGNDFRLGPGGGDLEVQFAAPEFSAAANVAYRYRLKHFDDDWVYADTRNQAFYTRLGPGHYIFEVQASLNAGPWSSPSATVAITVKPHIWQTPWFRLAEILAIVAAAVAVLRFRIRVLLRRTADLESRVERRTLALRKAVHAAEQAQDALRHLAERDSLTNIWNRRAIFDIASREYESAKQKDNSLCLVMADIDRFKSINDTYGHQCGDKVIQEVVMRLSARLRPYDYIGRYGGEELLIVLPIESIEEGRQRAEELREAVCGTLLKVLNEQLKVTCSFGVAILSPEDRLEDIIDSADAALYEAKAAGRNRVCVAGSVTPGDQATLFDRSPV